MFCLNRVGVKLSDTVYGGKRCNWLIYNQLSIFERKLKIPTLFKVFTPLFNLFSISANVRFRWKADVGECLLYTESGRSYKKKTPHKAGHNHHE